MTQGSPTRLSATSAKVGRRFRKLRSGRVKVPFGRKATAARPPHYSPRASPSPARRSGGDGASAAMARARNCRQPDVTGRTGASRCPSTRPEPHLPSRFRRRRRGARRRPRRLGSHDPASSTIRASRTRLSDPARVSSRGRLRTPQPAFRPRTRAGPPRAARARHWRTFDDTRTNGKRRWHVDLQVQRTQGPIPIGCGSGTRAAIRSSSATRARSPSAWAERNRGREWPERTLQDVSKWARCSRPSACSSPWSGRSPSSPHACSPPRRLPPQGPPTKSPRARRADNSALSDGRVGAVRCLRSAGSAAGTSALRRCLCQATSPRTRASRTGSAIGWSFTAPPGTTGARLPLALGATGARPYKGDRELLGARALPVRNHDVQSPFELRRRGCIEYAESPCAARGDPILPRVREAPPREPRQHGAQSA